jgi:hypothetical protein
VEVGDELVLFEHDLRDDRVIEITDAMNFPTMVRMIGPSWRDDQRAM